jgi:hypothetical protein
MDTKNMFAGGLQDVISAIEIGAGNENNLIETAVGEIKIKGVSYQIQISLVKKELWINEEKVSASFVVRDNIPIN